MNKTLKKVLIAIGLLIAFIVGVGLFKVAENFILHSYSSGEIVLENTPEESTVPGFENDIVGDSERVSDIPDAVYPSKIYDEEGVVRRSKEYLGDEYYDYEAMFKSIVAMGDKPFEGLDDSGEYLITLERSDKGLIVARGLWGNEESLDEYDYCKLGALDGGAEAVYFYGGTRVVYKLNTKEPMFFVVDYSNTVADRSTDLVEFGGLFYEFLYLIPEVCNKEEIEGYTVYFSYQTSIVEDW